MGMIRIIIPATFNKPIASKKPGGKDTKARDNNAFKNHGGHGRSHADFERTRRY